MNAPRISVVVCTYNRSRYLERCLESLVGQTLDPAGYEIIVVDNRSTDGTADLCRRYLALANFRYLFEERQGLSYARNRGLEACRSPLVAYLDDDAVAVPGWLSSLLEGFGDPQVASAGGAILPVFEGRVPVWFHDSLLPLYSCRDRGREEFDLGPGLFFYGANMSFRSEVLMRVEGFPVHLGRSGDNLLSDEELVVSSRIERLGYGKRYLPQATVYHHIPAERLRARWLLRRFFWLGKGEAVREWEAARSLRQRTLNCLRRLIWTLARLVRPEYRAGWVTPLIPLATLLGYGGHCLSATAGSRGAASKGAST